jgi:hypothetical protein
LQGNRQLIQLSGEGGFIVLPTISITGKPLFCSDSGLAQQWRKRA